MLKYFCVSDIHGFYDELKLALDEAGFDPTNETHWLVVCGDCFDRGPKPEEVKKYLSSLPRKVLVKGTHEDLLVECCERGYPMSHDFSNGTCETICKFGNFDLDHPFDECCDRTLAKTGPFIDSMVNYFETKHYIFVHSFVPLICDDNLPPHYILNRKFSKMENWRDANDLKWEDARWGNPFELASKGLLPDKTLVFGHFHTSWARAKYEYKPEWGEHANFSPYYGDGYIGIDACCAYSGKINCLVIEDEVM